MPRVRGYTDPRLVRLKGDLCALLGMTGMTQKELARSMGVSAPTLSRRMTNVEKLTVGEVMGIQAAAKRKGVIVEDIRLRIRNEVSA